MNRIEPVYGLSVSEHLQFVGGNSSDSTNGNTTQQLATLSSKQNSRKLVNLGRLLFFVHNIASFLSLHMTLYRIFYLFAIL